MKIMKTDKMEYIFGFIGIIILAIALTLAICYDGHNYNIFTRTISSLGDYEGRFFFSIGFITAGCLGIPFYIRLERSLKGFNETVRRLATGISVFACLGIACIGVIPISEFPKSFLLFHGLMAFLAFTFTSIYIGLYSYLMLRDGDYSFMIPVLGIVVIITLMVLLITMMPIIEWILFSIMFVWITSVTIKKLRE